MVWHEKWELLVVAAALLACGSNVKSTRIESASGVAYRIDCEHVQGCVARAKELCPAGYDVAGSGVEEDHGSLLDILVGDDEDTTYHNQMIVDCEVASAAAEPPPPGATGPSRKHVGEFRLGTQIEDAARLCENAEFEWDEVGEWHRCRGIVPEPDTEGYTLVRSCDGEVCAIRLVYGPFDEEDGDWIDRFSEVRKDLELIHGEPRIVELEKLPRCIRHPTKCLGSKSESLRLIWTWPDHHGVELVARGTSSAGPYVMVSYAAPAYTRRAGSLYSP